MGHTGNPVFGSVSTVTVSHGSLKYARSGLLPTTSTNAPDVMHPVTGRFHEEPEKPQGIATDGVYFLANDRVLDLVVAFLNSFRAKNPTRLLCLIPFDDDIRLIAGLRQRYGFSLFDNRDILRECDDLSRALHGRVVGQYRKAAAWYGEFERFIYIDVDTIVLGSFDFVYPYLAEYDFVTGHSHMAECWRWTWKPSARRQALLSADQLDYAANTGFFASRAGLFSFGQLHSARDAALRFRAHMEMGCYEQAFFNFLIVTSGRSYTSLSRLARSRDDTAMPCECWAGERRWTRGRNGQWRYNGRKRPVLFIHWAGCWWPTRFDAFVEQACRRLGVPHRRSSVRRLLRHRRIWWFFRRMAEDGGAESGSGLNP